MNIQNLHKIFRQNFIFYLTGFLVILGMKYFYSNADCDDLIWILAPIAKWVELLSGIPFEYAPGAGYANHSLRLLIAPSCSGVQFMIITIAMLIFSFVHRVTISKHTVSHMLRNRLTKGFCWIITSIVLSYLLTIFINGLRIIVAIYLPAFLGEAVYKSFLTPDRLHTMIGIVVYFTALLTIYRLTEFFFAGNAKPSAITLEIDSHPEVDTHTENNAFLEVDTYTENNTCTEVDTYMENNSCMMYISKHKRQQPATYTTHKYTHLLQLIRKCLSPVFWYLSIALGIPFLNNAYQKSNGKFTEFALLILCCCTIILTLYSLILFLGNRLRNGRHM